MTSQEQDPAKLTELATEMKLVLNQKTRFSAARDSGGVARIRTGTISCPKVSAVLHFRRQLEGGPYGLFPGKGGDDLGTFFQRNVVLLGCKFPSSQFSESLGVLAEVGF